MDKFVIEGGHRLEGTVEVSGSKNAALPILAASLLTDKKCVIKGVPPLSDVNTIANILRGLGVSVTRRSNGDIETQVKDESQCRAPYELVSTMRASVCVLGPLLAKRHRAEVSLPGGCVIGIRPIDLHLKGFKSLGATVDIEHGYVTARATRLRGTEMFLGGSFGSTVTGTANVLMAAALAEGRTVIENSACEPEVQDLCEFLLKMGANIKGVGTHRLVIEGAAKLGGAEHKVIPDRIEAGTLMVAAAITQGDVTIEGCRPDHLGAVIDKLSEIGVAVAKEPSRCRVMGPQKLRPTQMTTLPYPGFPTDMQAQLMTLLSLAEGISVVSEKVYPDRFMHVAELNRMGADIRKEGATAIVHGVDRLSGTTVMASDLRASAALVLAGLAAKGTTQLTRVYHVDRGYEKLEKKLESLGARIERQVDKRLVVLGEGPPARGRRAKRRP
ncbi:MAG: UDP-N-acetylglucosamine 1-carboxyvinyltransferase [Planctomycetota bacterium]|nr:UDP-N-acetylglucosamine 1-carboxyvinyltransferase [Planctomycetota bacterium]